MVCYMCQGDTHHFKYVWLDFLEVMLRYLSAAAPQLEEEDLRRAVVQAFPEGERIMATIAEKWVQQGVQQGLQQGLGQGERQVLLRQVRHRFGEATARQSETLLARITDPTRRPRRSAPGMRRWGSVALSVAGSRVGGYTMR
jgi:hypothetical protein